MLGALRQFLQNPQPSEQEALSVSRVVYVLSFMAQVAVAAVLTGLMAVLVGRQSSGNLFAQILVVLSLLQLPISLLLSFRASKAGGKQAALSASIMAGVLLSTPAWFVAMMVLVSSPFLYLGILFAILMLYYGVGFMLCGRWAKVALQSEQKQGRENIGGRR